MTAILSRPQCVDTAAGGVIGPAYFGPPWLPAPTPTAPHTTPPTAPSATPSTHPHGTPHHPTNRPLRSSQHPPPQHPTAPHQPPPLRLPAPAPTKPHTTPSTAPSAAPKASFKIPAQKKIGGADKKKWNQGSVAQEPLRGRTTPSPA